MSSFRWFGAVGKGRPRCSRAAYVASVVWVTLCAATALAEPQDFPAERLYSAMDGNGIIGVEYGAVPIPGSWDAGAWLGYANRPLVLLAGEQPLGALVKHRLGGSVTGAVSVSERLQFGVDLPFVLYQGRDATVEGAGSLSSLAAMGLGDLRLLLKFGLFDQVRHGVDVALQAGFTVPTGGATAFRGESYLTSRPALLVSRAFGQFRMAANMVAPIRRDREALGQTISSEVEASLGAAYRFKERTGVPLEAGVTGSIGTSSSDPFERPGQLQSEVRAQVGYEVADGLSVSAGGGAGFSDGWGTPVWRTFIGVRYVQHQKDSDGDRIRDSVDACPYEAEDWDGFDDEDGCPDLDNDKDGIPDDRDQCPNDPEDFDGFEDEDGCPDLDNDRDGVPDDKDQCPLEPEDIDTHRDWDGCPDSDNDGDGIPDELDQCPHRAEDFDGFQDEDGCPDLDNDGDGIPDEMDQCPNEPEDYDTFFDDDGCPDPDNDKDGVLDVVDRCPLEAGPAENRGCPDTDRDGDGVIDRLDNCPDEPGPASNSGCVEKQLAALKAGVIEIHEEIYFTVDSDAIEQRSFRLLQNVAKILNSHPEIEVVRIQGHTDDQGSLQHNMDLSQRRADSVKRMLMSYDVDASRLVTRGYGPTRPVATNATERGRARNRRVVFDISIGGDDAE